MMLDRFAGQTVLVVGAASGIGRASARKLASQGAAVICMDRDYDGCLSLTKELSAANLRATAIEVDVTDRRSVREALAEVVGQRGGFEALVNCAGITGETGRRTHEVDPENFEAVYQVNLRGAFFLSQAAIPVMLKKGYGRILHVASIAGKEGNPNMVAYSATKAGLIGLVKTMGKEYARDGITINALAPAVIRTPLVDALPVDQIDYMTEKIPMGRHGTLDETADMISWVLSTECSFTTGFTFDLSGGRSVY